jgi:hypothetical protein
VLVGVLTVKMLRLDACHSHMLTNAVSLLHHEQLAILDEHILVIILGIDSDRRVVGSLPVVIDHEIFTECFRSVVCKHIAYVRHLAEIIVDLMGVDGTGFLHSLAAGALGTCCEGMRSKDDK